MVVLESYRWLFLKVTDEKYPGNNNKKPFGFFNDENSRQKIK
jgi:hypothetical protein